MSESIDGNGFSRKLCVTDGTVNYVVVGAVVFTVGIDVILNYNRALGVAECYFFIICCVVAARAGLECIPTLFGAGGSFCFVCYEIMAECGYFLLGCIVSS